MKIDDRLDMYKISEDCSEIDEFIEKEFIPKYIQIKEQRNEKTKEIEKYYSIQLKKIIKLGYDYDKTQHIIYYINDLGIYICGRYAATEYDIPKYEYIRVYKNEIFKSVISNKDNEKELFIKYKETNDKSIREKIILNNIKLARYIAIIISNYCNIEVDELESYAFEGLCKAVDSYDYTLGISFSSYASPIIKGYVKSGLAFLNSNYKRSSYYDIYYKIKKYIEKIEAIENEKISDDENLIDKVLELMIKDKIITKNQRESIKRYIYANLSFERDNIDILEINTLEDTIHKIYLKQLKETLLKELPKHLNKQEFYVIANRFELMGDKSKTLEQIGIELGLSRERIRQIENKAIYKIKKSSLFSKLEPYVLPYNQFNDYKLIYNYFEANSYYTEDIYEDNYDYKKPPRRKI